MTDINKQKFLAELGKLLTFMYEEDRQIALEMYEDLFALCEDEQQMIQHLVSPTRQAVVLARAYDSKAHMLSVHTQSRREEMDEEEMPRFVSAIENIQKEAEKLFAPAVPKVNDGQISLFGKEDAEVQEVLTPAAEASAVGQSAPAEAEAVSDEPETDSDASAEDDADTEEISLPDDEADGEDEAEAVLPPDYDSLQAMLAPEFEEELPPRTVRHSPLLVILYLIPAIPLTLLGIALLLVPTLLFLALSVCCAVAGLYAISSAFGSFMIFADILVVLGGGLILLALGLLFLWTFVWFIGGVIAGLVNGVIKLGEKLSAKEVSAV